MANWTSKGTVRTTKHGDIRWTTFSVFHGEERWRSEGIQIGGINSGRGILGEFYYVDCGAMIDRFQGTGSIRILTLMDRLDRLPFGRLVTSLLRLWEIDQQLSIDVLKILD